MNSAAPGHPRPRDVLGRPILLLAVLGLALNDHVLKGLAPGHPITGKLSDVTGLFAAPLVAWALLDLLAPGRATSAALTALAALAGAAFAAIKTLEPAHAAWLSLQLGLPAQVVPDLGDLLCLPCVALARAFGAWHLARPMPRPFAPRAARVARVATVLAFVVLTTATSVILPPRPVDSHVLSVEGEGAAVVDSRAYVDRPFEVALPPGPWRSARAVLRTIAADVPPAGPLAERVEVIEHVLLEIEATPDRPLVDPVILALPPFPHGLVGSGRGGPVLPDWPSRRVEVAPGAAPRPFVPRIEVRAERADGRPFSLVLELEEESPGPGGDAP
jgi:hypothetical protein